MKDLDKLYREKISEFEKRVDEFVKGDILNLHDGMRYPLKNIERGTYFFCHAILNMYGVDNEEIPMAVDLIHSAAHTHDDIMDGDKFRSNKATVWYKYGMPHAINIADGQFNAAYTLVLKSKLDCNTKLKILELMLKLVEEIIEGQTLDLNMKFTDEMSPRDYMTMIEYKSGSLGKYSVLAAGVIAGADENELKIIGEYGKYVSMALRIRDDNKLKKDDLREGKRTLPLIKAVEMLKNGERSSLIKVVNTPREETTDRGIKTAIDLIEKCGALEYAKKEENKLVGSAKDVIKPLSKEKRTYLLRLIGANKDSYYTW